MENQTHFDLEGALRDWTKDCASQPGISLDDARELQSDLRERVADLRKRGVSECEAIQEAVRQIGSPATIAREFARENPWAVWRERLLWMVGAGFAISIWQLMTIDTVFWLFQWFSRTYQATRPFSLLAWANLAGHLPVLGIAVLLACGRLHRFGQRFQYFLQARERLVLVGGSFLVFGILIRLLAPTPLSPFSKLAPTALNLMNLSAWPVLLWLLGILLSLPGSLSESAGVHSQMLSAPKAVWRDRVRWMAVGGLTVGFWFAVGSLGIRALFYTGGYLGRYPMLMSAHAVLNFGFAIVILLLRQWLRGGHDIPGARLFRRRPVIAVIPPVLCAWAGLHVWSLYLSTPRGSVFSFPTLLTVYFDTFQWFWPLALAALVLWLAPNRAEQELQAGFAK